MQRVVGDPPVWFQGHGSENGAEWATAYNAADDSGFAVVVAGDEAWCWRGPGPLPPADLDNWIPAEPATATGDLSAFVAEHLPSHRRSSPGWALEYTLQSFKLRREERRTRGEIVWSASAGTWTVNVEVQQRWFESPASQRCPGIPVFADAIAILAEVRAGAPLPSSRATTPRPASPGLPAVDVDAQLRTLFDEVLEEIAA